MLYTCVCVRVCRERVYLCICVYVCTFVYTCVVFECASVNVCVCVSLSLCECVSVYLSPSQVVSLSLSMSMCICCVLQMCRSDLFVRSEPGNIDPDSWSQWAQYASRIEDSTHEVIQRSGPVHTVKTRR